MKPRKVAVIIGSDDKLTQCRRGLLLLHEAVLDNRIEVKDVVTASVNSDIGAVFAHLANLAANECDVIIADADLANQCDSFLRYTLRNSRTVIVGVVFVDKQNHKRTIASKLNMTEARDSLVVFNEYVGESGFFAACFFAAFGNLPEEVKIKKCVTVMDRTLIEAIKEIEERDKKT